MQICTAPKFPCIIYLFLLFLIFLGALAAPANLHVVFINTTTIHLRWEPPFTLRITGTTKPEISNYLVQITNLNTGNVTRVNVTASEYFLLADRDCITYEVHVLAVNDVGEGNLSESVTITSLGGEEVSYACAFFGVHAVVDL